MLSFPKLVLGAVAALLAANLPASAAPLAGSQSDPAAQSQVDKAQFGLYFGYGAPYGYDRPYYRRYSSDYYDRPYYRPAPPAYYYSAPAADYDDDAVARCASQFRSFDPRTGTYVTYEGDVRLCPYLRE